ncbi:MAG: nucleotide exchange factor GrpE [Vicinamibacterales bacterium]
MAEKHPSEVKVVDRRWWARGDAGAADDAPSRKPTAIEDLEQQLAEQTARMQAVLQDQRRSQQELDDLRARLRREAAREAERGRRSMLAELLEVVDNLDRALSAVRSARVEPGAEAVTGLARGVALVRDQFLAKLEQFGVSRLDSLGQPFDAARHEAISTAPVDDLAQDGVVVIVVKEGYAIGDDLLRPASVIVGRADRP